MKKSKFFIKKSKFDNQLVRSIFLNQLLLNARELTLWKPFLIPLEMNLKKKKNRVGS
jgi:hypothetical protein